MGNACPGRDGQTNPTAVITGDLIQYVPSEPNTPYTEIIYRLLSENSTPGSSPIVKFEWGAYTTNASNTSEFPAKAEGPTYTIILKRGQEIKDVLLTLVVTDMNGLCNSVQIRLNFAAT